MFTRSSAQEAALLLYPLFLKSAGVCIDSRKMQPHQIFFALQGVHLDGHAFAKEALAKGALAVVVSQPIGNLKNESVFYVDNVLTALQALARLHRQRNDIPLLAITGSNGKTTTKELIAAVLGTHYKVYATKGNFNNHIGVPLSLLEIREHEIAVIEMGANHLHEIEQLCALALPNFGLITQIGKAHLEGFGSEQGVQKAKKELYDFLRTHRAHSQAITILLNLDDPLLCKLAEGLPFLGFSSQKKEGQIQVEILATQPLLSLRYHYQNYTSTIVNTQLFGAYNASNLAYSIAAGILFKVPFEKINQGLANYLPSNQRSELLQTKNNTLILDCYNANPTSMAAALAHFSTLNADKLAILGDLLELGESSLQEHITVYELVNQYQIPAIWVGKNFSAALKNTDAKVFTDTKSLADYLKKNPPSNTTILLKASNGLQLNTLVEYL